MENKIEGRVREITDHRISTFHPVSSNSRAVVPLFFPLPLFSWSWTQPCAHVCMSRWFSSSLQPINQLLCALCLYRNCKSFSLRSWSSHPTWSMIAVEVLSEKRWERLFLPTPAGVWIELRTHVSSYKMMPIITEITSSIWNHMEPELRRAQRCVNTMRWMTLTVVAEQHKFHEIIMISSFLVDSHGHSMLWISAQHTWVATGCTRFLQTDSSCPGRQVYFARCNGWHHHILLLS